MRVVPVALALLLVVGCSGKARQEISPNQKAWRAGDAVFIVTAVVTRGQLDVNRLARLPGVIAASQSGQTLKLSMGRQALLVDLAAVELQLQRTAGVTDVHAGVGVPAH